MKLGVSLYPEQESFEEIQAYLKTASKYGFQQIFTSMFSVPGEKDEVLAYFKKLCDVAHEYGMEVYADSNAYQLEKYGVSEKDLSVFKEIGLDAMRMDGCYGDDRDLELINNKENIKIQFSCALGDYVSTMAKRIEKGKITVCHNFYPQRYTGIRRSEFMAINETWKELGFEVAGFISSQNQDSHGPWPVKDGLPTCEAHRNMSVKTQVREMLAMGNVGCIIFGNAFATEEELKAAQEAVQEQEKRYEKTEVEKMMEEMTKSILPNLGEQRVNLYIHAEDGLGEVEKKVLFDFKNHVDMGDSSRYMVRSRVGRMVFSKQSIPVRAVEDEYFKRGDVLVVNDNLAHYAGELQICLEPMKNDGQRNRVGYLDEEEMQLIPYLKPGVYFDFAEK